MRLFRCKHSADGLVVVKGATIERIDADFDRITYHLMCTRCREEVKIKHAHTRYGVSTFLKSGESWTSTRTADPAI